MDAQAAIVDEKKALRARCETALRSLSPEALRREGMEAAAALGRSSQWAEARTVFAFLSMNREIVSDFVVDAALSAGKTVALPRVEDGELSFREVSSLAGPWATGSFGIREPLQDTKTVDLAKLSGPILVVAPGVAFDADGGRLGHGKGYYDRFLRAIRALRRDVFVAALCIDVQLVERVPMDVGDERMDAICAGGRFIEVGR
jgi:5-formyltetrahydrofolate cyclo-ligase